MDAFHPQSTRQHTLRHFGARKQQLRVINDQVMAQARPALRTQTSLLLEKQSGFPDTEEFRSREKEPPESLGDQRSFGPGAVYDVFCCSRPYHGTAYMT